MAAERQEPMLEIRDETGKIGKIPLRNLWLLMFYAAQRYMGSGGRKIAVEESPDDIPDLAAAILTDLVNRRIRRNLSCGFRDGADTLNRVRGRIDTLQTERGRLLDAGKVACRFDHLTVDTPLNRFVRGALETLEKRVHNRKLAVCCRKQASCLRRMGVGGPCPEWREAAAFRHGLHDADDRRLLEASHLAFELALPTEAAGERYLPEPDRDMGRLRILFEQSVLGFYSTVLAPAGWTVKGGKRLDWPVARWTPGMRDIFPGMQTDIVLVHPEQRRRIVIDTKFNSVVTPGWRRKETLRNGYLYQMYAYLRTQEENGDPLARTATGVFLHPAVDRMLYEAVEIQGHEIRFATVDLSASTAEIRKQLREAIEPLSVCKRAE